MLIEELDPELFLFEEYNPNGTWGLSDACHLAESFGWCDASRLLVRPKPGELALMVRWPNGVQYWCHILPEMLESIRERVERLERVNRLKNPQQETQDEGV